MTHPMWDVIVIGSGMGGSMAAGVLAKAGLTTLVLESGALSSGGGAKLSFKDKLKQKLASSPDPDPGSGKWRDPLLVRQSAGQSYRAVRPVVGELAGGSGALYGAALGRARRSDFEVDFRPADWLADAPSALPNAWPVGFDTIKPFYRRCEAMLRVAGTRDPLDPDDDADLREPPSVSGNTAALVDLLTANGRHPYRMHVGIDYLPGCSECQGSVCLRRCKSDSFGRVLAPLLDEGRATMRSVAYVDRIERKAGGHFEVVTRTPDGKSESIAARLVVLAAGALNSPLVLQRSADLWPSSRVPEMVGGGLMFHFGDIFAVMDANPADGAHGPFKTLGFRDHYMDGAMPLAECQSLGMAGSPWMVGKYLEEEAVALGLARLPFVPVGADIVGRIAAAQYRNAYLFTSNLEDLPYRSNRVEAVGVDPKSGQDRIGVTYRAPEELMVRARRLRALQEQAFAPLKVSFLKRLGAPNLGHPMGTCRMGDDPQTSVVDPSGQVWGQPGLFVVDASAFASSLGINPALTVAANALRVAEGILAGAPDPLRGAQSEPAGAFDTP
ncbi:GMC family oxidoreductase [Porphyrobacter sp. YT40]|uniref:GMC oxidoreductase n=1 Tax=Porphyrobacter sp. YT40 TaxID=2547601 RepID=UPI0011429C1C|nr:GMC family oxidoreductase [Porphyrobacter sp. YT40]QDH33875.1 GMC family oxidoreductase [Porphyrobacter sp. YT40]